MNENSFYSLDRLMEFGMSLAVARQMIGTMNHTLSTMQAPNMGNSISYEKQGYYALVDGSQAGPFSDDEVSKLFGQGKIGESTLMWRPGMTGWMMACDIPQVFKWILLGNSNHNT